MARLVYTTAALNDLKAIARYIATRSGSRELALAYTDKLREKCANLASHSFQLGTPRPELGPDLRSLPVDNYVIFFRRGDDLIEIVNVLEGHRDVEGFFGSDEY